jgi:hypothetical protein
MEGWKLAPNDLEQKQTLTDEVQLKAGNLNNAVSVYGQEDN